VWLTVRQKGREAESQLRVMSLTGGQGKGCVWVTEKSGGMKKMGVWVTEESGGMKKMGDECCRQKCSGTSEFV
jgi:hypothetical protein